MRKDNPNREKRKRTESSGKPVNKSFPDSSPRGAKPSAEGRGGRPEFRKFDTKPGGNWSNTGSRSNDGDNRERFSRDKPSGEGKFKSFGSGERDKSAYTPRANRVPRSDDRNRSGDSRSFGDKKPFNSSRPTERKEGFKRFDGPANKSFSDRNSRPERSDWAERKSTPGRNFSNDRPERGEKPFRSFGPDRGAATDRNSRPERNFSSERGARSDRNSTSDRSARPDRSSNFSNERNSGAGFRKFDKRNDDQFQTPDFQESKLIKKLPPKVREKYEKTHPEKDDSTRLNKYIANAGLCSRREADDMIASGSITVNGKVITEMGYQVMPGDTVKYGKDILSREKLVYVLLNKPKDFITTMDDPDERKTVMDLVKNACRERVYPVGRLDRNTTGLLLLTNDGELTEKLTHPANNIRKIYQVEIDKPITEEHFEKLQEGIELEDGFIKPDQVGIVTPDAQVIGIEIHSGKNRIVRRMFEALGYEVTKLDRTTFAGLTKKDLPRGNWRFLDEKELIRLKYML